MRGGERGGIGTVKGGQGRVRGAGVRGRKVRGDEVVGNVQRLGRLCRPVYIMPVGLIRLVMLVTHLVALHCCILFT